MGTLSLRARHTAAWENTKRKDTNMRQIQNISSLIWEHMRIKVVWIQSYNTVGVFVLDTRATRAKAKMIYCYSMPLTYKIHNWTLNNKSQLLLSQWSGCEFIKVSWKHCCRSPGDWIRSAFVSFVRVFFSGCSMLGSQGHRTRPTWAGLFLAASECSQSWAWTKRVKQVSSVMSESALWSQTGLLHRTHSHYCFTSDAPISQSRRNEMCFQVQIHET